MRPGEGTTPFTLVNVSNRPSSYLPPESHPTTRVLVPSGVGTVTPEEW